MAGKGRRLQETPVAGSTILLAGVASFLLGVLAEHNKPEDNPSIAFCIYPKYSRHSSSVLGTAASILLLVSSSAAVAAIGRPYKGQAVPWKALCKSTGLVVFGLITLAVFLTAEGLLLWATIAQSPVLGIRAHKGADYVCGARPGLFGGAAFLALDATLLWLVCLMLAVNAKVDMLGEAEDEYGELPVRYSPAVLGMSQVTSSVPSSLSNVD